MRTETLVVHRMLATDETCVPHVRRGDDVSLDDQVVTAARSQMDHVRASRRVDRRGWTRQQWIDDARIRFNDLNGSVLDLLNGHIAAMLDELDDPR